VLTAPTAGRGPQLAAGLAVADRAARPGDVILFLHADAELPYG
jgi:cell wall-associated NlpC family hydrolase